MQLAMHMVTIEDLMPREHLMRKLEAALDLSFVYEETAPLYSEKYGRPPIDPVVIVKYLLVGFLYGIPSEREIERRVQTDIALRWYLGLDLFDRVPDHSTVSQLRRRKPSFRKVFRRLFEEVVRQCIEKGLVSGRVVGTDSTHVKANASRASEELVEITEAPGVYWERLDEYEEEGLEKLERRTGKRRKKRTKGLKRDNRRSHKRVSRRGPGGRAHEAPGKAGGASITSPIRRWTTLWHHRGPDCDRRRCERFSAVFGPDRAYSSKCCTNSDRYRGRRLRFSAGPSGAGRAGDRLFRAAAEDRRAGRYTVHAGRFSL
ncbi:MAG: transposase [Dysosmobacter sp.]